MESSDNSAAFSWRLPPYGWLKLNVCGIAIEDKAGCGGILRDLEGIARGLFYGAADSYVVEEAEMALEVFASINWKSSNSLVIEVGSSVVFSWCINKGLRPWSLQTTFSKIEYAKRKVGTIVFSLVNRNSNDMTFSLALAGVNRTQVFKIGGDFCFV
ncbi:hypothetical protein PVK06_024191 [Gossypium arboreum]|uniref:RNase H type-1 domain-containing protein n=1 Tax=Gossypium arboreum TaxID=29729 RepID=A0ABR0PDI8_GOSAR|nr:hypothetical protein PVK06_024191 [Gossypium arboreum]